MMEQALNNGQQQIALELAQLAPVELKALLHPFLGGQWQNNTPRCVFLLSPAGAAASRLSRPRRAASGRTNLCRADALRRRRQYADRRSGAPLAGLPDGLRWHFYIRSTLCWHNGDTVETVQLRQRLLLLLELPALRTLFASISRIDVTHAQCLTMHRPDYWLPFRLASYCSVLAHPDDPAIGCGPFRLKRFSPELVRRKPSRYHLQHPLIRAVEYWITPQLLTAISAPAAAIRCRSPSAIAKSCIICVRSATVSALASAFDPAPQPSA